MGSLPCLQACCKGRSYFFADIMKEQYQCLVSAPSVLVEGSVGDGGEWLEEKLWLRGRSPKWRRPSLPSSWYPGGGRSASSDSSIGRRGGETLAILLLSSSILGFCKGHQSITY